MMGEFLKGIEDHANTFLAVVFCGIVLISEIGDEIKKNKK